MKLITAILVLIIFLFSFGMSFKVSAGNPPPLFDKPIKLDDSGKPLYNSWERQEYMRKQKAKKKRLQKKQTNSQATKKSSSSTKPTPSSAVINRPIQSAD